MKAPSIVHTESAGRHMIMRLDAGDVIQALHAAGVDVPADAEVVVEVPTGGDYSGMELDIGPDAKLEVRWVERA